MQIIARQHEHHHFVQVGSRAYNYEQNFFNCAAYFFNYAAALLHICEHTRVHQSALSMLVGTHDECLVRAPLAGARIATMRMVWGSGRVPEPRAAAWMTHFGGSRSCELALAYLH